MDGKLIHIAINGEQYEFLVSTRKINGAIPPEETLATTLRERLNLTGTKIACGEGACGACTVLLNNRAVSSCITLTVECDGKDVVTIEGLQDPVTGELDPIQQAFIDYYAFQCGFCTPGIIMAAKGLFIKNPHPDRKEVEDALSGNMCRCISQYHALDAIMAVSEKLTNEGGIKA
ncbi:MAG: (2Fe-2S)-binding protein [Clostridia bacterium]|nr:(2Fe-2S)-binding protein [Clostridia bacterium]